ncbi:hypothetical protein Tco_0505021 [Tanacetum coccineum]
MVRPDPKIKGSQPWVAAAAMGHRSNNYSESKRNDHLDNNRRQEQRNKCHSKLLKQCASEESNDVGSIICWGRMGFVGNSDSYGSSEKPSRLQRQYIRLEEEKARKSRKVYNWETATYGKIWDYEDIHNLRSVETDLPAIVFNDTLTSEVALSCEPTVSSLNDNEINFRISFDESDDEDYTVIYDKNSFSYKIISVNDLKTDSENDNEKVNMPSFLSPEPMVSCFDDLDFFKDFENEFPAIVYNDALTSKSDFLTEHTVSPQHIDEFNLKAETSLSEYKDIDDNKVDIEHSLGDLSVKLLPDVINTDVGAYAHGTVYTTYSLNEYNVFDIASTDAIRNQGASIKTVEIQIEKMSKVLQERGFGSLPSSTEANPRDQVKSILTTIEVDSYLIRRIGSNQYAKGSYGPQFSEAHSEASHINNSIPQKEKDLGSFTLPCFINNVCFDNALVDLGASVSVMPFSTYLNLGLGKLAHTKLTVELADKTVKYPKGIAKNMLVVISKFVFPVDFVILDMPEDIKVPLILGRPFLSTARAKIDIYKRKITLRVGEERIVFTSVKPASSLIKRVYMLSLRERMELNLEARLMGETLVINRSLDHLNRDYIELNDLNEPFELRRNQGDDLMPTIKEGEVIKEFRTRGDEFDTGIDNYPSYCDYDKKIHIDFLEDIDAYHDEGMGDVIFGEPFLREVGIKAKRFEWMITIYNGNDEVIYQMVRSHLRFKHHTNKQCNKIPPLLKVSDEDKKNGISHPYQKLKGFYKGDLNLGPDYIRDAKTKEWIIRGHISAHEME